MSLSSTILRRSTGLFSKVNKNPILWKRCWSSDQDWFEQRFEFENSKYPKSNWKKTFQEQPLTKYQRQAKLYSADSGIEVKENWLQNEQNEKIDNLRISIY